MTNAGIVLTPELSAAVLTLAEYESTVLWMSEIASPSERREFARLVMNCANVFPTHSLVSEKVAMDFWAMESR